MSESPLKNTANQFARLIDKTIDMLGNGIAWMTLAMVVVMAVVVILRFAFDIGWVWLQESVNYLHAYIFMLGAAYTLRHDGHVRVDVFYRQMSTKRKALVDLLGTLFLLIPVSGFIFYASWAPTIEAWTALEGSQRTGGLDFAYILKSSMLLMPALLILQGLAISIQKFLIILDTPANSEPQVPDHG
ncbi:TRAP dicarboxylate transporter, DctQ subunit, unknown substrate 6 [hydrothermal vent metagenome]|uniref:Tripartite ATP-independent periplasmic transporters DctQ component domain-containing protein n=1 Tax=hydrothermal vent metagenome TaxID=652676 RepID=A0A3B1ATI1_9ZZZZ